MRNRRSPRGNSGRSELARLESTLATSLFTWPRPDSHEASGGLVTSFVDRVAPGTGIRAITANHAYTQATDANKVGAIGTSALVAGRAIANCTGAQFYTSNAAAGTWSALNNTPMTFRLVYVPRSLTGVQIPFATSNGTGQNNVTVFTNGSTAIGLSLTRNTGGAQQVSVSGAVVDTPRIISGFLDDSGANPARSIKATGVAASTAAAITDADGTATAPMTLLGIVGGANGLVGYFADLLIWTSRNAIVEANVDRYLYLRYGLVP